MFNHLLALFYNHLQAISDLLNYLMIIGVIAASISGAIRAIEAKMDITGAVLLAFITANAGGTIRDLILGAQVFWVHDQIYIWLTLIIGALTFISIFFKRKVINNKRLRNILIVTDAMGLAAFCLAGVEKSVNFGQNEVIAIIMGIWTAIGGGVIADVISNRVPLVFSQELYISVAFIGASCYLVLSNYMDHIVASLIAAIIMICIRLYSVQFKWKLPTI